MCIYRKTMLDVIYVMYVLHINYCLASLIFISNFKPIRSNYRYINTYAYIYSTDVPHICV